MIVMLAPLLREPQVPKTVARVKPVFEEPLVEACPPFATAYRTELL